jgi:acylphosphatase
MARNLPDGRVEVIVAGEPEAIETLAGWLHHGPPQARVERVERSPWTAPVPPGFEVG